MKAANYFNKNGYIYGISSKFYFGRWTGYVRKFESFENAVEWLNTEEHDFRERELCSQTKALKWFNKYGQE